MRDPWTGSEVLVFSPDQRSSPRNQAFSWFAAVWLRSVRRLLHGLSGRVMLTLLLHDQRHFQSVDRSSLLCHVQSLARLLAVESALDRKTPQKSACIFSSGCGPAVCACETPSRRAKYPPDCWRQVLGIVLVAPLGGVGG